MQSFGHPPALANEAVSVEVAGEWIFGDGEYGPAEKAELLSRNVLDGPWLRVPLFLTLFSSLYFATHSLASKESRLEYFQGLDSAVKIRFAIRLAYRLAQSEERRRGTALVERGPRDEVPDVVERVRQPLPS